MYFQGDTAVSAQKSEFTVYTIISKSLGYAVL